MKEIWDSNLELDGSSLPSQSSLPEATSEPKPEPVLVERIKSDKRMASFNESLGFGSKLFEEGVEVVEDDDQPWGGKRTKTLPRFRKSSVIVDKLLLRKKLLEEQKEEDDTLTIFDFIIALSMIGIAAGVTYIVIGLTGPGLPTLVLPAETRDGEAYIGVFFLSEPSDFVTQAFAEATKRWSEIVLGSDVLLPRNQRVGSACGFELDPPVRADHLQILVDFIEIDGEQGVLGAAGPCVLHSNNLPLVGLMNIDEADVETNLLSAVVLHEIGHILGIGSLWPVFDFIKDPLDIEIPLEEQIPPSYIGPRALAVYRSIIGEDEELGIENGFTNGNNNGASLGSLNGHFDEDSMGVELMTFRIRVFKPPLSIVTIRALQDFGYVVRGNQADEFNEEIGRLTRSHHSLGQGYGKELKEPLEMKGDILDNPMSWLE